MGTIHIGPWSNLAMVFWADNSTANSVVSDTINHIRRISDGVVLVDPEYVKDRKVFGHVLGAFRYGREDLDVLGLTFRKDLYLSSEQIFPPTDDTNKKPLTRLQERLIKKLGPHAYPFFFIVSSPKNRFRPAYSKANNFVHHRSFFQLPPNCPASVTLQPAAGDTGKVTFLPSNFCFCQLAGHWCLRYFTWFQPCGVDYELKACVGDSAEDKPHKRWVASSIICKHNMHFVIENAKNPWRWFMETFSRFNSPSGFETRFKWCFKVLIDFRFPSSNSIRPFRPTLRFQFIIMATCYESTIR